MCKEQCLAAEVRGEKECDVLDFHNRWIIRLEIVNKTRMMDELSCTICLSYYGHGVSCWMVYTIAMEQTFQLFFQ